MVAAARADALAGLSPERQLQRAVQAIRGGRDGDALKQLFDLTQREPNFRLAHLLYGELLALRSGNADALPLNDADAARLRELQDEFQVRVGESGFAPPPGSLPSDIVELAGSDRYALLADLARSRLYVLGNSGGQLHVVNDLYSTLARNGYGKHSAGDLLTPVGIYRATSFTPASALPAFYGAGAFPLNYPNVWDRAQGRTGSGIWLHGVPSDTYSRPPRASEGCVVLANDDLLALKQYLSIGDTPVIFSDHVDWVAPATLAARRGEIEARVQAWRDAWADRDSATYADFYADSYRSEDGSNKPRFAESRLAAPGAPAPFSVTLSDLSLFAYPGQAGLVLAQFTQDYGADSISTVSRRDQYWQQQADGRWKIAREEIH
jgi:murein L,D-transpeptidase YafK